VCAVCCVLCAACCCAAVERNLGFLLSSDPKIEVKRYHDF
jgi:hypothetical protein